MPRPNKTLSGDEYAALRQRFSAPEANYSLINGDHPVFSRRGIWDGDYTREQYLRSVDHIVGVLDGTIVEREIAHERSRAAAPDVVIWLDKSARPCSWFVDAFWEMLAAPGSVKPRYEFLRIDRRDWLQHMGYSDSEARNAEPKSVQINDIPDEAILRLRVLFCDEVIDTARWRDQVSTAATTLDDYEVLVVDETMVSGATLSVATGIISRVAPSARVSGTYFWRDTTSRAVGKVRQPATVPIWYPGENSDGTETTVFGRGVGNSSASYWLQLPDSDDVIRRRLAAPYISAPHHHPETFEGLPDQLADMLAQDIAYLTYDYAAGNVLRRPSFQRPDESYDQIIAGAGLAFADFVAFTDRRSAEIRQRVKTLCQ